MSEKVTFGELIEAIAEETDRSKQFTHDFLKDFVDVINGGLEDDGTVNIAGFGKFKLRRVDEREGYNPQTEEKITIPAHNKVVFKPYKDLRELVNAPYAHLEPELLDDEDNTDDEEVVSTEEKSGQDDFIPTGPPTSKDTIDEEEQKTSTEDEPPFDLEEETNMQTESEDDNGDIVEFNAEESTDDEDQIDDELNEFLGTDEASKSQEDNKEEDETKASDEGKPVAKEESEPEETDDTEETSRFAPSSSEETESDIDKEQETPAPAIGSTEEEGKRANSLPIYIAAAFILLVLAGGAWYFSLFSNGTEAPRQMAANETSAVSQQAEQATTENDQQAASNQKQDQQKAQPQKTQQNQQQATNTADQSAASSSTKQKKEAVNQTIEKGQTLWSLAEDKYGNPRLWPWIYGKNEALQNPNEILAGSSLSVPLPSGPQNNLNAADSVGVAKGFIATYQWYKGQNSSKAKNHLWGAKLYHDDIRNIADVKIDQADLAYANQAR